MRSSLLLFLLLVVARPGFAELSTVYDFESIDVPAGEPRVNFDTPLAISQDGLTMTISHESDIPFSINVQTGTPLFNAQFDLQALSAFNGLNGAADPGAFILDFDRTLTSITVEMGDFGADFDNLLLQAFDGAGAEGNLLASDTGTLPQGGSLFGFETLTIEADGIQSIRMIGGGDEFPNSVFFDNIAVTAIPEPSSLGALGVGLGALCLRRRTRTLPARGPAS